MLFPVSFLGGRVGCCSRLVALVVEWGVGVAGQVSSGNLWFQPSILFCS